MSEPKFTPGPWVLDNASEHVDVISDDYHFIDAGNGYFDDKQGFGISGYMSIHDARLIAASPDLFEACQMLLVCMSQVNREGDLAAEKARAAITKALGG